HISQFTKLYSGNGTFTGLKFKRCLLSLVLLAPLFVRQFGMATVATAVLAYSLFIVPAITNYFSPLKIFMTIIRRIYNLISKARYIYIY
ncbi:hypothetical protein Anas_01873, partial [Armadillidium nasatum]